MIATSVSGPIVQDGMYAAYLITGMTRQQFGIVRGSDIQGMLKRSSSPASLWFTRIG